MVMTPESHGIFFFFPFSFGPQMISLELLIDPVHSCTASKQINRKLNGLKRQAFVISQFLRLGSGHSLAGRF